MNKTVLITNGNTLSMLSLASWLEKCGRKSLVAIFLTTKLPSSKSNLDGVISIYKKSGFSYTFFKLWVNRILPFYLKIKGLPYDVPSLCKHLKIEVPICLANDINTEEMIAKIKSYQPEIVLSFSATQRFVDRVINCASRAAINAHYSLLPAYAGLSPYFWYLYNGEKVCGSTLHVIKPKLDAGPIITQEKFDLIGFTSVMQVALRQAESISLMLNKFYDGEISENDAFLQDLSKRSYFKHPSRDDVRKFYKNGFKFIRVEDKRKIIEEITKQKLGFSQ